MNIDEVIQDAVSAALEEVQLSLKSIGLTLADMSVTGLRRAVATRAKGLSVNLAFESFSEETASELIEAMEIEQLTAQSEQPDLIPF